MDLILFVLGIIGGALLTYVLLRGPLMAAYQAKVAAEQAKIIQEYAARIHQLEAQQHDAITHARRAGAQQSRAVLKGKMAEQMAPLLPGFNYWPSDARFLGDPVDYIVFNGYSACKDGGASAADMEIVILDVKQGKSTLNQSQRQIAQAIEAGRVRFEVVRVYNDGSIRAQNWPPRKSSPDR